MLVFYVILIYLKRCFCFKKFTNNYLNYPVIFSIIQYFNILVIYLNFLLFAHFSGFDFGYMLKFLTCSNLPNEESEFFDLLRLFFCNIYDVKYLMKSCKNLKGGLQEVSDQLEVSLLEILFV